MIDKKARCRLAAGLLIPSCTVCQSEQMHFIFVCRNHFPVALIGFIVYTMFT